ncbi:hypothetical protein [Streptomyces sp. NBC_01235]|uniref:hypothetical protein n=1 Tax=Streptomyces sp. NBC_01235 TaxID=2903788 RepID=UPI003FA3C4E4
MREIAEVIGRRLDLPVVSVPQKPDPGSLPSYDDAVLVRTSPYIRAARPDGAPIYVRQRSTRRRRPSTDNGALR